MYHVNDKRGECYGTRTSIDRVMAHGAQLGVFSPIFASDPPLVSPALFASRDPAAPQGVVVEDVDPDANPEVSM